MKPLGGIAVVFPAATFVPVHIRGEMRVILGGGAAALVVLGSQPLVGQQESVGAAVTADHGRQAGSFVIGKKFPFMIGVIRSAKNAVPTAVGVGLKPPIRMMTGAVIVPGTYFSSAPARTQKQRHGRPYRWIVVLLLHIRQQAREHGSGRSGRSVGVIKRELPVSIVIIHESQAELLQVVAALHSLGGFAHSLNRGQQQGDEDTNDGNHHEQLD